jgi:hypothetical protein
MKALKLTLRVSLLFMLALTACNTSGSEEGVSADAISNPLSADTKAAKDNSKLPVLTFDKEFHDFGTISEGEKVTYSFKFTNTGKADLIIQTASGSCGCTVPEVPKEPIKPGGSGFIKVQFNSENRVGIQEKQVTVVTNAMPNTNILRIKAEVSERS